MPLVVVRLPSGKEIQLGELSEHTTLAEVRSLLEEEALLIGNVFKILRGVKECADHDVIGSDVEGSRLGLSAVITSRDPRVLREPRDLKRLALLLKGFRSHQLWVSGRFGGDGDLFAVFDRLCLAPEKQLYTPKPGSYLWRLPVDAEILRSIVPWQKTFGIDPLEIEAVLSLVAVFAGFLDVRDGGGRVDAVLALASGDLVAVRANYYERCGFMNGRDRTCSAIVRAKSMEELSHKAGGFLRALQGESVGELKVHFGGLHFSFDEDAGIPLDFWRKQQYRSSIESEDPGKDTIPVGEYPSSGLHEHPLELTLPKIVKRAIQVTWADGKDGLSVLGGRTAMYYEDWMREFGEQRQHELVKDFLKHVSAARAVIKLADQQAVGGKIDKLQEAKLEKKTTILKSCAGVGRYVEEGSELWNKGKDVMENGVVREIMQEMNPFLFG